MTDLFAKELPEFPSSGLDLATFGQRLRHLRRARGYTLAELGSRVGRAPSALSLLENGRREPKLSLIDALARALAVPAEELLRAQPPSRRAQLEIAVEEAQHDPLYAELGLPHLKVGARVPNDVLEHLVGLHAELRRQRTRPTATPEEARVANAGLRDAMRERGNYFPEIERAAAEALESVSYRGGALSQGALLAIVGHQGFSVRYAQDLPRSVRSVTDLRHRRIYLKQESMGMHTPRTILLQTLGHFVLGHAAPRDFADFLRQRVEANYYAAAVLVPERTAARFLAEAKEARDLSVEDLRDVFSVSYEMAAHRFTNLATHHLELTCHFVKNDEGGIIYKAYENDGLVLPADSTGAIEGQRMCRKWSGRQVFAVGRPLLPVLPVLGHAGRDLLVHGARGPGRGARLGDHPGHRVRELTLVPRPGHPHADDLPLPGRGLLPAAAGQPGHPLGGDGLAVGAGPLAHPVRPAHGEFPGGGRVRRVRVPRPLRLRVTSGARAGRAPPGTAAAGPGRTGRYCYLLVTYSCYSSVTYVLVPDPRGA